MDSGQDERRVETGLARRQHIEARRLCVRVDRDDAADRQAPCQAGPGAGVYAGRGLAIGEACQRHAAEAWLGHVLSGAVRNGAPP
jgi:hypothetical protein